MLLSMGREAGRTLRLDGEPDLAPELLEFFRALVNGLEGDAGRMQQALRRSLRRPPPGLDAALVDALKLAAAQAAPPVPGTAYDQRRSLLHRSLGPVPVEGQRFPAPSANIHRWDDLPPAAQVDRQDEPVRPVLAPNAAEAVAQIIAEHTSDFLRHRGVPPTRTVLLTGPPGTGKTITARWIARQIGRPLLTLDLAQLMSHELGRSAQNLQATFRAAREHLAVLFIDEFDAVASARSDSSDIGEMRRLVNVLLLSLDEWPPGGLLIAATNHPELLDRAVNRRFERALELSAPDADTRALLWHAHLPSLTSDQARLLAAVTTGMTGSDIATAVLGAFRSAALNERDPGLEDLLRTVTGDPSGLDRNERDHVIQALHKHGLSLREIAPLVGCSHVTVGERLKALSPSPSPRNAKSASKRRPGKPQHV
jgi:hypothetical protein